MHHHFSREVENVKQKGLFSQVSQWIAHPRFSEGTPTDWLAFAVLLMLAGFLWRRVLHRELGDVTAEV
jgi:hypothetical protein